jgi:hypothetical protein
MSYFSGLASGSVGTPIGDPVGADEPLIRRDGATHSFYQRYSQLAGYFTSHFAASVPHAVAEECRIGTALWLSAEALNSPDRPLTLYTLGSAEGVLARTAVLLSAGRMRSLSCSPNIENQHEFCARGRPAGADFYHGLFVDVVQQINAKTGRFASFFDGFDYVIEDTTFQMYSRERYAPIRLVTSVLKESGILLLIEKLRHHDMREYTRRERQKDVLHKLRYFSKSDIDRKADTVLSVMFDHLVTLDSLAHDVSRVLEHCALIWNAGNFYVLAASRSATAIESFVRRLCQPFLIPDFCHEAVPRRLFGLAHSNLSFRQSDASAHAVGAT